MVQILEKYATARFDLTDVAIMAVAERLNIRKIVTFDRRAFGVFRPARCAHFELLPKES